MSASYWRGPWVEPKSPPTFPNPDYDGGVPEGTELPSLRVYRIRRTWLRRSVLLIIVIPQTLFWLAWIFARVALRLCALLILGLPVAVYCLARDYWSAVPSFPRAFLNTWRGKDAA